MNGGQVTRLEDTRTNMYTNGINLEGFLMVV